MKISLALALMVAVASPVLAGDQYVKGHYRDTDGDGYKETYVQPHHRTDADGSKQNNYSSEGNYNPYTGKQGTENPYKESTFKPFKYTPSSK